MARMLAADFIRRRRAPIDGRRQSGEVDLVVNDEPRERWRQIGKDRAVLVRHPIAEGRIDQHEHEVRAGDRRARAFDAERLDRIRRRPQAGCVDDRQRDAAATAFAARETSPGASSDRDLRATFFLAV